ncbi:MAG TPA: hypothetical protein VK476_00635, partial [Flavobacterium sp.]|nr:hypothetical protein [Flavobacterium sp.]
TCSCDTTKTKQEINKTSFNKIPQYDTVSFTRAMFYDLDPLTNKMLWYRDIENPDTTKFTKLWNDYVPGNYHAQPLDFVENYENRQDIPLAFQFGPNTDLWAYHSFVIRKMECCYLITRSYFRHARFTYKAYSIIDQAVLDSLRDVIGRLNQTPLDTTETFSYCGYFVDNGNNSKFFVDFDKEKDEKEISNLYDFVDNKIKWTKTY